MDRMKPVVWGLLLVGLLSTPARSQPAPPIPPEDAGQPVAEPAEPAKPNTEAEPATETEPAGETEAAAADSHEPTANDETSEGKHKKKDKKGKLSYKPGRWLRFRFAGGQELALRLLVQPVVRFGQLFTDRPASVPADATEPTVDLIIRRARLGFKAALSHGIGFKWEIQIKNMHFGLSNLYGIWNADDNHEIQFGFLKPPGGLERDAFSFDEPFIERSIVAFLTLDHEMGGKAVGWEADHTILWQASITRNAPPAVDGGDPEDAPRAPPGGELEDLTRPAGNWNAAAEMAYAPSDTFEVGARAGIRNREEIDPGDRIAEPYDSAISEPRAWTGLMYSAQAHAAQVGTHYRVMAEGGVRRDGHALAFAVPPTIQTTDVPGHMVAYVGYLITGWTPNGHYGPAVEAAPLLDGTEITLRVEGAHANPPEGATDFDGVPLQSDPLNWFAGTIAYHWEVTRTLRLQWDAALERGNKAEVFGGLRQDLTRLYLQFWATYRL